MNLEKPRHYELMETDDPKADGTYVWESSEYFDTNGGEESWSVRFEHDGKPTNITFFPERPGVKLTASDSPGYDEGKVRAEFGLVLIKLMRSGTTYIKEL